METRADCYTLLMFFLSCDCPCSISLPRDANVGLCSQLEKSSTIRESNQISGVSKAHYAVHYVWKNSILLAGTGIRKIISVACGFRPIKIHYSD